MQSHSRFIILMFAYLIIADMNSELKTHFAHFTCYMVVYLRQIFTLSHYSINDYTHGSVSPSLESWCSTTGN